MSDFTISRGQLRRMLDEDKNVFIIDVRPLAERNEWRIAESVHVDVYDQLRRGDRQVFEGFEIPTDRPVVTVCAAGKTSLLAATLLREKGVEAFSLEGGMKAWNYAWNTAEMKFPSGLKVIQVRRPAKGVLSYMVGSGGEAVVIDAALDPEVYLQLARENSWKIRCVTDTHVHADFISRTPELARQANAMHLMPENAKVEFNFTPVRNKEAMPFGNASLVVVHTPGHTWESISLQIGEEAVFTGDTLFVDGIGRPDLKADPDEVVLKAKALFQSLRVLSEMPSQTMVFPAHSSGAIAFDRKMIAAPVSTVVRNLNVPQEEELFVEWILKKTPPVPPNYMTIASLNRKGSHEGHSREELEAGGNHCAVG